MNMLLFINISEEFADFHGHPWFGQILGFLEGTNLKKAMEFNWFIKVWADLQRTTVIDVHFS